MYYGMSSGSLAKMYVQGSLANKDDGFTFKIKNLIDSGSVSGLAKVTVDDEERSLDGVTIELNGNVRRGSQSLVVVVPLCQLRGRHDHLCPGASSRASTPSS